jgi:hypothetical protein
MEPESHRLDREALRADHLAVAERVQREVDAFADAATAKRRAFLDEFVDRVRIDADLQRERDRIARTLRPVLASGPAVDREQASPGAGRPDGLESVAAEQRPLDRVAAA